MDELLELEMHPFVSDVLSNDVAVLKSLGDPHPSWDLPECSREPDEHEFFLMRAGFATAQVLNCCRQLHQIPVLLSNHRQTATMDKAGIDRHSQLVYHIENYLIRTQSLLDRIVKLVDAVFHLTNDPRHCRYDVVIRNVKVEVSEIPQELKKLRKLLEQYAKERNEIIHHHSINDDTLRRLDLYLTAARLKKIYPDKLPSNINDHIKESIFEVIWFRKNEFIEFNTQIAQLVRQIFFSLRPYYGREERALRGRLTKPDNPDN